MKKIIILILLLASGIYCTDAQNIMPAREGRLWGFINDSGRMVHPAVYSAYFSVQTKGSLIYYAKEGDTLYFIGNKGIRMKTSGISLTSNISSLGDYILVKNGSYFGLRDMSGTPLLPDSFSSISLIDSKLFLVQQNKTYTILDDRNRQVLPAYYTEVLYQNDFIYTYNKKSNSSLLFDREGKQISDYFKGRWNMHSLSKKTFKLMNKFPRYVLVYKSTEGYNSDIFTQMNFVCADYIVFTDSMKRSLVYHVKTERGIWFMNATINYLPCCNALGVSENGSTVLFDTAFRVLNTLAYSQLRCANNILITADDNGYYGLADKDGDEMVKPRYASISNFNHGLALYTDAAGGRVGAIDEKGREILKKKFKRIDIDSGLLVCYENDSTRYYYELDKEHNITSSTLFSNVSLLHTGFLRIRGAMPSSVNGTTAAIPNCTDCNWFTDMKNKKIGLRDDDNSIAISAVFSGKSRIPGTPYYLVWVRAGAFEPAGDYYTQPCLYGIVDYAQKKIVIKPRYLYIDVAAIERKKSLAYTRVYSGSRGHELLMPDLKTKMLKYPFVASLSNGNYIAYKKGAVNYKMQSTHYYCLAGAYLGAFTMINRNENIIGRITHPYIEISNAQWYLLDSFGNAINATEPFSYVRPEQAGSFVAISNNRFGIMNISGNWLLEPVYQNIPRDFSGNDSIYLVLNSNARMGAMNKEGTVIINADYSILNRPDENTYATALQNNTWGVVSSSNVFIPVAGASKAKAFSNELAAVKIKGKWGYADYSGQLSIPCEYTIASDFSNGMAVVFRDGMYHYIDVNGDKLFGKSFTSAQSFSGGYALVKFKDRQNRYRLIDSSGNKAKGSYGSAGGTGQFAFTAARRHGRIRIFSNHFSSAETYKKLLYDKHSSHLLLKTGKGRWDIIDKQGYLTGRVEAADISPFTYRNAVAKNAAGQYYVIDETGALVYGPVSETITQVFDTFMVVQNKKEVLIKSFGGREIRFDKANSIEIEAFNTIARIKVNNRYYSGSEFGIFPNMEKMKYKDLNEDMTAVEQNGKIQLLDTGGFLLNQRVYKKLNRFYQGMCVFTVGSTCGLYQAHKGWVLPCRQDLISWETTKICRFERDNDFGYVNVVSGKIIWQKTSDKSL